MAGVLATYPSGPSDFYARKAAQTAEALSMFADAARRRKERRAEQDAEELDRFFKTITTVPELANSPYATEMIRKYGAVRPELAPLVEVIRKREQIAQETPRAGEHWLTRQGALERQYAVDTSAFEQMPNTYPLLPGAGPIGGMAPFDIPNPEKMKLGDRLSRVDPTQFPMEALRSLPPMERAKATIWAKTQGVPIPEDFNPWEDLPQDIRAAYAVDLGKLGPEAKEATLAKVGAKPSKAKIAEQEFKTGEREGRESQQVAEREAREKHAAAMLRLSDSLQRSRMTMQAELTRETTEFKVGLRDGDKVSWKTLAEDNENMIADWNNGLKAAIGDTHSPDSIKDITEAYVKANGKRPRRIPQAHLASIAAKANKALPDHRQPLVDMMLTSYLAAAESGAPGSKALMDVSSAAKEVIKQQPVQSTAAPAAAEPAPEGDPESEIAAQVMSAAEAKGATPEQAQVVLSRVLADYQAKRAQGMTHAQAMAEVFK